MNNPLERTKIALLAHSKNMLNAAESGEWERFAELDSVWMSKLEQAHAEFGEQLAVIRQALLEDSKCIQLAVEKAQQSLCGEVGELAKASNSIKSYLK